jgi:hypothetical protein
MKEEATLFEVEEDSEVLVFLVGRKLQVNPEGIPTGCI